RGYRVTGVELSDIAVGDFFAEQGIAATSQREGPFEVTQGAGIRLLCGDFFDLQAAHTAGVAAVYDRAALIALPAAMRGRYLDRLLDLIPAEAPILLLTLEYPAGEIEGPPFSVDANEVQALFAGRRRVELLESLDCLAEEPALAERGLTRLVEHAFLASG
ncbi:MAG: thiopurine S-methyltransferase, partial [Gammaproteobacteria bacterium]|nr:thiopurine S-methyltransferase [Gammaproteobacteria bacterium]